MLFGLAVVIALLFACLWLIRRLSAPRGGGAAIKVLGAPRSARASAWCWWNSASRCWCSAWRPAASPACTT
jgi:hypothetical protein